MSEPYTQVSPQFNADSAYVFIEKQVAFGSRVPGTKAHELCGDYLVTKLQEFGAEVIEQNAVLLYHYNQLPT
jgi:glutaminyl-peptide cyclotransferase